MGLAREERARLAQGEGCLGKAADDEPVFILRGQDILAPQVVRTWAKCAQGHLGPDHPKIREALGLARLMEQWSPRKFPD